MDPFDNFFDVLGASAEADRAHSVRKSDEEIARLTLDDRVSGSGDVERLLFLLRKGSPVQRGAALRAVARTVTSAAPAAAPYSSRAAQHATPKFVGGAVGGPSGALDKLLPLLSPLIINAVETPEDETMAALAAFSDIAVSGVLAPELIAAKLLPSLFRALQYAPGFTDGGAGAGDGNAARVGGSGEPTTGRASAGSSADSASVAANAAASATVVNGGGGVTPVTPIVVPEMKGEVLFSIVVTLVRVINVGGWTKESLTKNAVPLLLALLDVVSCAQTRIAASRVLTAILSAGSNRQRGAIRAAQIFPACGACALDKLISLAQDIDPRVRACVARLLSVIFSAAATAFFTASSDVSSSEAAEACGASDTCCVKAGPPILAALSLTSPRVVATRCAEELFELLSDEDGGVRAAATASALDVISFSPDSCDRCADTFGARALLLLPLASLWLAQMPRDLRLSLPGGADVEAAWGGAGGEGGGGGGGPLQATAAWAKKGVDTLEAAVGTIIISRAPRLLFVGLLGDFIREGEVPVSSLSSGGALSVVPVASSTKPPSPTVDRTPSSTTESSGGKSPKGGGGGGRGRGSASGEPEDARLRNELSSPPALLQSLSIFLALSCTKTSTEMRRAAAASLPGAILALCFTIDKSCRENPSNGVDQSSGVVPASASSGSSETRSSPSPPPSPAAANDVSQSILSALFSQLSAVTAARSPVSSASGTSAAQHLPATQPPQNRAKRSSNADTDGSIGARGDADTHTLKAGVSVGHLAGGSTANSHGSVSKVDIPSTAVSAAAILSRHVLPAWVALAADADDRIRLAVALSLHHVAGALGHEAAAVVVAPVAAALLADASAAVSSALVSTASVWLPAVAECCLQRRVLSLAAVVPALLRASSHRRGAAWRTDIAALEALRLIPILYPAAPACDAALSVTLAGIDACAPVRAAAVHSLVWWARHAPCGRTRTAVIEKMRAIFAPARRTLDAVREHLGAFRVKGNRGAAFVMLPAVTLPLMSQQVTAAASGGSGEEEGGSVHGHSAAAAVTSAPVSTPPSTSATSATTSSAPPPAQASAPLSTTPLILPTDIATSAICAARLPKTVSDASGLVGRSTLFGPAWRRALVVDALGAALWVFSRRRVTADFLPPVLDAARYDPIPSVRLAALRALPALRGWLLLPHDADALNSIVSALVFSISDADERVSACARCGLEKLSRVNAAIVASLGRAAQDPARAAMLQNVLLVLPVGSSRVDDSTNTPNAVAVIPSTSRSRTGSTEGAGIVSSPPSALSNMGNLRSRSPAPPLPPSTTTTPAAAAGDASSSSGRVKPAISIATIGHIAVLGHAVMRRVNARHSAEAAAQNATNGGTGLGGVSSGPVAVAGAVASVETALTGKVLSAPPTPVGPSRKSAPLIALPASPMLLPSAVNSCPSPSLAPSQMREAAEFGGGVAADSPARARVRVHVPDAFAEEATAVAAVVLARETDFFSSAAAGDSGEGGSSVADGLDAVTSASPFFRNPFRSVVTVPLGAAAVGDISSSSSEGGLYAPLISLDSVAGFCGGGGDVLTALWSGVTPNSNLDAPLSSLLPPPGSVQKGGEKGGSTLRPPQTAAVGAPCADASSSAQSLPSTPMTMHYCPPTFASLATVIAWPLQESAEPDAAPFKGRLCADNLGDFFKALDEPAPPPLSPVPCVVAGAPPSLVWSPSSTPRPPPRPVVHTLLTLSPAAHTCDAEVARVSAESAQVEVAKVEDDDARLRALRLSDTMYDAGGGGGLVDGAGGVGTLDSCESDEALISAWPLSWRAALQPLSLASRKAAQLQPHASLTVSTNCGGGRRDIAVTLNPLFSPLSSRIPPPPSVPGTVAVEGWAFLASAKAQSGCVVVDVFAERDRENAGSHTGNHGGMDGTLGGGDALVAPTAVSTLSPILHPALDALSPAGPRLAPFSSINYSTVATPSGLEILSASLVAHLLQGVAKCAAVPGSPLAVAAAAAAVSLEESNRVTPSIAPSGAEGDDVTGDAAGAAADLTTRSESSSVDPSGSASTASGMSSSGSARWGGNEGGGGGGGPTRNRASSLAGGFSLPVASLQGSHGASAQPAVSLSLRGAQLTSLPPGPSGVTVPLTATVRAPLRGLAGSVVCDAGVGTVAGGLLRGARVLRAPLTISPLRTGVGGSGDSTGTNEKRD